MSDFRSFREVATYIRKSSAQLEKNKPRALDAAGRYLQNKIKERHWVKQPWRPEWSNPTPLVKTGWLRDSVKRKLKSNSTISVYSDMAWLWLIHEYWVTYRMTDKQRKFLFSKVFTEKAKEYVKSKNPGMITIPARPIWRVILDAERWNIANVIDNNLSIFE